MLPPHILALSLLTPQLTHSPTPSLSLTLPHKLTSVTLSAPLPSPLPFITLSLLTHMFIHSLTHSLLASHYSTSLSPSLFNPPTIIISHFITLCFLAPITRSLPHSSSQSFHAIILPPSLPPSLPLPLSLPPSLPPLLSPSLPPYIPPFLTFSIPPSLHPSLPYFLHPSLPPSRVNLNLLLPLLLTHFTFHYHRIEESH